LDRAGQRRGRAGEARRRGLLRPGTELRRVAVPGFEVAAVVEREAHLAHELRAAARRELGVGDPLALVRERLELVVRVAGLDAPGGEVDIVAPLVQQPDRGDERADAGV